jgi:dynein light intermediate chain
MDELIRQVTINCAERGLLLLRVRDEMRMSIAAYQVGGACVAGIMGT